MICLTGTRKKFNNSNNDVWLTDSLATAVQSSSMSELIQSCLDIHDKDINTPKMFVSVGDVDTDCMQQLSSMLTSQLSQADRTKVINAYSVLLPLISVTNIRGQSYSKMCLLAEYKIHQGSLSRLRFSYSIFDSSDCDKFDIFKVMEGLTSPEIVNLSNPDQIKKPKNDGNYNNWLSSLRKLASEKQIKNILRMFAAVVILVKTNLSDIDKKSKVAQLLNVGGSKLGNWLNRCENNLKFLAKCVYVTIVDRIISILSSTFKHGRSEGIKFYFLHIPQFVDNIRCTKIKNSKDTTNELGLTPLLMNIYWETMKVSNSVFWSVDCNFIAFRFRCRIIINVIIMKGSGCVKIGQCGFIMSFVSMCGLIFVETYNLD